MMVGWMRDGGWVHEAWLIDDRWMMNGWMTDRWWTDGCKGKHWTMWTLMWSELNCPVRQLTHRTVQFCVHWGEDTITVSVFQTDSRTEPGVATAGWNQAVSQQFGLSIRVMMVSSVVVPWTSLSSTDSKTLVCLSSFSCSNGRQSLARWSRLRRLAK